MLDVIFVYVQGKIFRSSSGYGTIGKPSGKRGNGKFDSNVQASTVSFHDINYVVQVKVEKQKVDKFILKDVE